MFLSENDGRFFSNYSEIEMFMKHIILPVLAIWLFIHGCVNNPQGAVVERASKVRVSEGKLVQYASPKRCIGSIAPKSDFKLSFKMGGVIAQIYVDEGQSVSKGQKIATLEPDEVESHVEQARLVLEKAERDFRRADNLFRDTVITLEHWQNAKTALGVAQSDLRIAEFNLRYTTLYSPIDGFVLKKLAEPGEVFGAGHPVLVLGSGGKHMVVEVSVTDKEWVELHLHDSASIQVDALGDVDFSGKVIRIDQLSDLYTGTYGVEIAFDNVPTKLAAGMMARVNIFPDIRHRFVSIPFDALLEARGNEGYVYVVINDTAIRRKVVVGAHNDNSLLLESGVELGERVITAGKEYIVTGKKVEIVSE